LRGFTFFAALGEQNLLMTPVERLQKRVTMGPWFTQPAKNRLTVTNQWIYQTGSVVKRFDVVFLVNGLPLVIGEAKTPTRSAVTWFDGAYQVNEIYEKEIPAMFVPNVFSFATEGRVLRYGAGERHIVHVFAPEERASRATVMFIHGGYWQALHPSAFSHLARGLNKRGITVADMLRDLFAREFPSNTGDPL
jgi:hypothetical protein